MSQPKWKFVANLGDTHPISYGGYFIFIDETGVYPPQAEKLEEPADHDVQKEEDERWKLERRLEREFEKNNPDLGEMACEQYVQAEIAKQFKSKLRWRVYRFMLEPCTYINGVLSDNKFHPDKAAWFADSIEEIARCSGQPDVRAFISAMTGDSSESNLTAKAFAWIAIGEHFGFDNLDNYPLELTRAEVEERYKDLIAANFKPT